MAVDTSFTIWTQEATDIWLGGSNTKPGVTIGFTTNAHGIYGEALVFKEGYTAEVARGAAAGIATILETLANLNHVVGVEWAPQTSSPGFLYGTVTLTVASASGNSTATLGPWPITSLPPNLNAPKINALSDQLSAAEGQSGG